MQSKIQRLVQELNDLDLPNKEFAVFGSGPMAIRGLKEPGDLDVIVKQGLWDYLSAKYGVSKEESYPVIHVGGIDFFNDWESPEYDINKLIDEADLINGVRYVKLGTVLAWKKQRNKEKDKKDVTLIEDYLKQGKN
jgi:hypothetical protein